MLKNAGLLRGFLQDNISQSADWPFLFLDGLDEMVQDSRRNVLDLLRTLLRYHAHVKAFLASQYRDDIHESLESFQPERYDFAMGYIEMRPTLERDRILVEHLVFAIRWRPARGEELKREVVEQIARRAEGPAIWLQVATTALEFNSDDVFNDKAVQRFLTWLQTDPSLIQLYCRLSESRVPASRVSATRRKRAEAALESLKVARRPLSIQELTCAVFLDEPDVSDLETLDDYSGSLNTVMDHIRPFVSVEEKTERYSLVHQSLVDLILNRPPTQWESLVKETVAHASDTEKLERQGRLHAAMLSRYIKYIMFDDIQSKDLKGQLSEPAAEDATREFLQFEWYCNSEEASPDPNNPLGVFDPDKYGFGKFFAYAGTCWPDHFAATPQNRRPEPSRIVQLCGYGMRCLPKWVGMWKKPSRRFVDERLYVHTKELDPLTVVAYIDPTAATLGIIAQENRNSPASSFAPYSEWNVLRILIEERTHHLPVMRQILNDPVIGSEFCDQRVFTWLLRILGTRELGGPVDWPGSQWEDVFRALMEKLGRKLEAHAHFTLRLACKKGCLLLVKVLFEASEKWPELGAEMLSDRAPRADEEPNASLAVHQSVGEAAFGATSTLSDSRANKRGLSNT